MNQRRNFRFALWALIGSLVLAGCGLFGDQDASASNDIAAVEVSNVVVDSGDERWFDIDPADVEVTDAGQPTQATLDLLREEIANVSINLRDPIDAGIEHDGSTFVVAPSSPGQAPDLAALALAIRNAAANGESTVEVPFADVAAGLSDEVAGEYVLELNDRLAGGITVAIDGQTGVLPAELIGPATTVNQIDNQWEVSVDFAQLDAALARMFPDVGQAGGEASFTIEESGDPDEPGTVVIIPGTPQTVCCDEASVRRIEQALTSDVNVATLLFREEDGERGTAWAENLGIEEQVASFTSNFTAGQSRVTNIRLIAELTQGVILMPGETFSLNEHVGQRTTAKGFVPAGTIVNGHLVDSVGGGISQFATTLFNASFFAGLEFDAYQSHSIYFSRYPYGREATISWPAPALIIANPSPYPVLIWSTSTASSVTVEMYSTPWVEAAQTGQFESTVGEACTRVTTERTRTFVDDGSTDVDSVFAIYRPEGIGCDGEATEDPDAEQVEALENGEDPGFENGDGIPPEEQPGQGETPGDDDPDDTTPPAGEDEGDDPDDTTPPAGEDDPDDPDDTAAPADEDDN